VKGAKGEMNKHELKRQLFLLRYGYEATEDHSVLADPTFYRWLRTCGIVARGLDDYTYDEIRTLQACAIHLSKGKTLDSFQQRLINIAIAKAKQNESIHRTTDPIQVDAIEVG
jgi:hypothetical protein